MRKLEKSGAFDAKLSANDPNDTNSYKVRKGRVGSYQSELKPKDIAYLDATIQSELHDDYKFYKY